ncbi:hypothetical protein APASM_1426 [Actinosynnema pretiosum subsp. pretiosum]|nr:hypothetical protein APASM_1426 [Actinosynnema pretiosum subsp. pretiosum]
MSPSGAEREHRLGSVRSGRREAGPSAHRPFPEPNCTTWTERPGSTGARGTTAWPDLVGPPVENKRKAGNTG